MRHIRLNRPQPATRRLDPPIARLLASGGHAVHCPLVVPQDPRRSALYESDRPWNSRLVSCLRPPDVGQMLMIA